jgi:acyl transferase domain-containing protein
MKEQIEEIQETGLEVAVIGMSCKFPGADNIREFWDNLEKGVESISFFSDRELEEEGVPSHLLSSKNYVKAMGILSDIELFDYSFFNYTPVEALKMDPQLRLFHQVTWESMEDAGYNPKNIAGLVGVYAGIGTLRFMDPFRWAIQSGDASEEYTLSILNNPSAFATRISYTMNFKGPSLVVQTACSTSLVAVHLACQGLLNGECDLALAGGVSVSAFKKSGYIYQKGMICSSDGHCRAFDQDANGTVPGDGIGVVVLKRLSDTIDQDDHLYAVIKGSAVNNDGMNKVGYTAPGIEGQANVIQTSLEIAEVDPETITYIETHGTGTKMGDPIEIEALKLAFNTEKKRYCGIGSVKTNVGHLDSSAGIAGFMKTVLSIFHRKIPPSLNFKNPNPNIDFEDSPFYVNQQLKEWKSNGEPLRAGVSSFGIGGTNAHVILEEAFSPKKGDRQEKYLSPELLILSAKTQTALEKMTENLADYLERNPGQDISNIAYTLQMGRQHFNWRKMVVRSATEELAKSLSQNHHTVKTRQAWEKTHVVFLFPGQGSQYENMGRELYESEPLFRKEMDRCFNILETLMDVNIKDVLFPHPPTLKTQLNINDTQFTQPILFSFEYALATLLKSGGIHPKMMMGHSIGEFVAAHLSGVFSLEEALRLVVQRGNLMKDVPEGDMLTIAISEEELESLIKEITIEGDPKISIAAINSPTHSVVSGTSEAINQFYTQLIQKGYQCRYLHTSHAFHSEMMDLVVEKFEQVVKRLQLKDPQTPFISNVTGQKITREEANCPSYWAGQLRKPVLFSQGVKELLKIEQVLFLEVGPGNSLTTFVRQHLKSGSGTDTRVMNLILHPKEKGSDTRKLLESMGTCWLYGVPLDWQSLNQQKIEQKVKKISLPTYPFEGIRFPIRDIQEQPGTESIITQENKKLELDKWFYVPAWKRIPLLVNPGVMTSSTFYWMVFKDKSGLGKALINRLNQLGQRVVTVEEGQGFSFSEDPGLSFRIRIGSSNHQDLEKLFEILKAKNIAPQKIIHLWNYSEENRDEPIKTRVDRIKEAGFYLLMNLLNLIGEHKPKVKIQIFSLVSNLWDVVGEEHISPEKSLISGLINTIPNEYPDIDGGMIDVSLQSEELSHQKNLVEALIAEFLENNIESAVAYRKNHRWVRYYEPVKLEKTREFPLGLRNGGVYLITGGLGGIGLKIAEYLVKQVKARLILTSPSVIHLIEKKGKEEAYPDKETHWGKIKQKIEQFKALGGEVLLVPADISQPEQVDHLIREAINRFGEINGVIHSAGVPDGGLIREKTREQVEKVLAPKVQGTSLLEEKLRGKNLEFFILCSSLSSQVAPAGQVAYTSANAFLDSFSASQSSQVGQTCFYSSINWDTWQEKGMAVEAWKQLKGAKKVHHPLIDWCVNRKSGKKVYVSYFNIDRFWVLKEHTLKGDAVLPATAFLELLAAAFENHTGKKIAVISGMVIHTPLKVMEKEEREVHTIFESQDGEITFSIVSRGEEQEEWEEHSRGLIFTGKEEYSGKQDLQGILTRLSESDAQQLLEQSQAREHYLKGGPRWKTLKKVYFQDREAYALLELPPEYESDLQDYNIHPALVDTASAFFIEKFRGEHSYLPFSYREIRIKGKLPRRIISKVILDPQTPRQGNTLTCHVTIMDETGSELICIRGFQLVSDIPGKSPVKRTGKQYSGILEKGVRPYEGMEVLERVLNSTLPQVIVSTYDLKDRIKKKPLQEKEPKIQELRGQEKKTTWSPPHRTTEKILVEIWEEILGVSGIGVFDNFFELGGDSLKGLTLISQAHKKFNVELSITQVFNEPIIRSLARVIDTAGKGIYDDIRPVERREYYSLSSAQQRIYFLQQMRKENLFYNLPQAMILEGKLEKKHLDDVFSKLLKRHESLRTRFQVIGYEPQQIIHPHPDCSITWSVLEKSGTPSNQEEIKDLVNAFVKPFNLNRLFLFRWKIIQMEKNRYLWLFDVHHIIADATAYAILMKDLMDLYQKEELTPLRVQYKEFSVWQNDLTLFGRVQKQEEYWIQRFSDGVPQLDLPTDFERPEKIQFKGDITTLIIDKEHTSEFDRIAPDTETTLFIKLLALFNLLLYKYTNQESVVIGCSVAGRPHVDLQNIVGMFVNMLPIRNDIEEGIGFKDYLKRVKSRTLEAFENQDMQFEKIVERMNLKGNRTQNPFFKVGLNYQNYEQLELHLEGLKITPFEFHLNTSKFDMLLWADKKEGEIHLNLEYSTELFKETTANAVLQHFKEILEQVSKNEGIQIQAIRIQHRIHNPKSEVPRIQFGF